MKALLFSAYVAATVLAGQAEAQACDRNKIDGNTMLSNNNGNYYTTLKSSQAAKTNQPTKSSNTGARRH